MCCSISFQVWQLHASKAKVGVIKIVEMSLFMIIVVWWVRLRLKHDSTPISAQIHETLLLSSAINRKLLSEWDFITLTLFWSRPFDTLNTLTREWALSTARIERASVITVFFVRKKRKKRNTAIVGSSNYGSPLKNEKMFLQETSYSSQPPSPLFFKIATNLKAVGDFDCNVLEQNQYSMLYPWEIWVINTLKEYWNKIL